MGGRRDHGAGRNRDVSDDLTLSDWIYVDNSGMD